MPESFSEQVNRPEWQLFYGLHKPVYTTAETRRILGVNRYFLDTAREYGALFPTGIIESKSGIRTPGYTQEDILRGGYIANEMEADRKEISFDVKEGWGDYWEIVRELLADKAYQTPGTPDFRLVEERIRQNLERMRISKNGNRPEWQIFYDLDQEYYTLDQTQELIGASRHVFDKLRELHLIVPTMKGKKHLFPQKQIAIGAFLVSEWKHDKENPSFINFWRFAGSLVTGFPDYLDPESDDFRLIDESIDARIARMSNGCL